MDGGEVIDLEQVWKRMQDGITKLKNQLEGLPEQVLSADECMSLYSIAYKMSVSRYPDVAQNCPKVYERCKQTLQEYINSTVLPPLRGKHEEYLLKELWKRWVNYKVMVRYLSHFFALLDRYYVKRATLPTLNEVGVLCFRDLAYAEMKVNVKDAFIAVMDRERRGEQIDRALLKNIVGIFLEVKMEAYGTDLEPFILEDIGLFYRRSSLAWIQEDSCPEYMVKAEECLKQEKEKVGHYLDASSEQKLLEKVPEELLARHEMQLLEKEDSGCMTLLRDGKVDDLFRMRRLFSKIPNGLESVAAIFKQFVAGKGTSLVQEADEAVGNKKAEKKGTVGVQEHAFVRKLIDLHGKCLQYVGECFDDHPQFHKALKEAFEVFWNKGVGGSTSSELLALFCDSLLKKGGSKKFTDEEIEDTLEKFLKLFAYISDKYLFVEFHKKKLARRLLFDNSANEDHERSVLTKLKQHCGEQYTSKMECMVTDLALVSENQLKFKEYLRKNMNLHPGIDLTVQVLIVSKWSIYKSLDMALPAEMVKCVEAFNTNQ